MFVVYNKYKRFNNSLERKKKLYCFLESPLFTLSFCHDPSKIFKEHIAEYESCRGNRVLCVEEKRSVEMKKNRR